MSAEKANKTLTVDSIRQQLSQPKLITLPSGIQLKVRRLSAMDYLKAGITDIPNEFYKFIAQLQQGKVDASKDPEKVKENYELFEKFLTITIEQGVVEPPCVFKYNAEKAETHLLFSELPKEDQSKLIDEILGR